MINALQPDMSMLKQASQIRETCEEKEAKLKRMRNLWLGILMFNLFLFLFIKFVLPSVSAYIRSFELQFLNNPYFQYVAMGIVCMILALTIKSSLDFLSAKSNTEKARKNEWRIVMYLQRQLSQK